jgi:hypothetical protein
MSNQMNVEANNTIYGSYGEFDPSEVGGWTDEDWAQYDAYVAEEIAYADARTQEDFENYLPDDEPPF